MNVNMQSNSTTTNKQTNKQFSWQNRHVAKKYSSIGPHCFVIHPYVATEQLKDVEKKTGYPKTYFFLAAVVLLGTIVTLVGGFKLLTDLVGFLYPAYMSFKSMESAKGVPEDATQWLTYWVVFSSLSVIESVAGFIIGWIPMYYFIKLGVIIWLYHPKTKGAEVIYTQVVKTHIAPHIEKLQGSAAAASKKKE